MTKSRSPKLVNLTPTGVSASANLIRKPSAPRAIGLMVPADSAEACKGGYRLCTKRLGGSTRARFVH